MSEQQNVENAGDAHTLQRELADTLAREGLIPNARVEEAFRTVPRHLFLPDVPLEKAYRDDAIVTKVEGEMPVSSSSQPSMMAIMLDQLDLREGGTVLEIGTATGYNAALMAHIVGAGGHVTTIEIDEDLASSAREHLAAAGCSDVEVIHADGAVGHPQGAPYDRIIVTVGAWDIPPAWLEQLAPHGRLVLPIALMGDLQESVAFERSGNHLVAISHKTCGFVHMRGEFSRQEGGYVQIGPDPNVRLGLDAGETAPVAPGTIYELLRGPSHDIPTGLKLREMELYGRLFRWLGYTFTDIYTLHANGPAADEDLVPYLFGRAGHVRGALGLLGEHGLAFLIRAPGESPATVAPNKDSIMELWVRAYGDDDAPAQRLIREISAWDAAGRPATLGTIDIEAYPDKNAYTPAPGDIIVDKNHVRIVLKRR